MNEYVYPRTQEDIDADKKSRDTFSKINIVSPTVISPTDQRLEDLFILESSTKGEESGLQG